MYQGSERFQTCMSVSTQQSLAMRHNLVSIAFLTEKPHVVASGQARLAEEEWEIVGTE